MEFLILLLLVSIGGSSSQILFESIRCNNQPEEFHVTMRSFPPNEQELKKLCPDLLEMMECYESEAQNNTGQSYQELATSSDENVALAANFFNSLWDLIKDVCNEETQFHKNYVESSQCFKEILLMEIRTCAMEAHRLYEIYQTSSFADSEEVDINEIRCITAAYKMACGMKETCGETAKDVLLEVVRRLQGLKISRCKEKNLVTLRGKFLDFLEEQGKSRDYYSSAFEF